MESIFNKSYGDLFKICLLLIWRKNLIWYELALTSQNNFKKTQQNNIKLYHIILLCTFNVLSKIIFNSVTISNKFWNCTLMQYWFNLKNIMKHSKQHKTARFTADIQYFYLKKAGFKICPPDQVETYWWHKWYGGVLKLSTLYPLSLKWCPLRRWPK